MSTSKYKTLEKLVTRLRDDLNARDFVLLYAYNGTGKTRLSMAFKEAGKKREERIRATSNGGVRVTESGATRVVNVLTHDTLYFNAYTEDLFHWDNDLDNDTERVLKINSASSFLAGFRELSIENKISSYLERYTDIDFKVDYDNWTIVFSREVIVREFADGVEKIRTEKAENIKVSRGEENIFIWCIFLAIVELVIDGDEAYSWVKYIYIDDPISSLDDNNAIAVASDLAQLLSKGADRVKTVISSHHSLFFNVMCNELRKSKKYFMCFDKETDEYLIRDTDDTPFFNHVAMLCELKRAAETGRLYTHHFNMMRNILEKTKTFFGYSNFSACIAGIDDEVLFTRAVNLLSHGKYSLYEPREMMDDTKNLLRKLLDGFLKKYEFELPEIFLNDKKEAV